MATSFPVGLDKFIELFDIPPSMVEKSKKYNELKSKSILNSSENLELGVITKELSSYMITTEQWNRVTSAVTAIETVILNNGIGDGSGSSSDISLSEFTEFKTKVIDLESAINEIKPSLDVINKGFLDLKSQVDASTITVNSYEARMKSVEDELTNYKSSNDLTLKTTNEKVSSIETSLNGKVSTEDFSNISSNVTIHDSKIATIETDMTTVKSDIETLKSTGGTSNGGTVDLTEVNVRISKNEEDITALKASNIVNENAIAEITTVLDTHNQSVDILNTGVQSLNNKMTTVQSDIETLKSSGGGSGSSIDQTVIDGIVARVDAIDVKNASQDTIIDNDSKSIATINTKITTIETNNLTRVEEIKALQNDFGTLNTSQKATAKEVSDARTGLSGTAFTSLKERLDSMETNSGNSDAIEGKVDKVAGKQLSTEDYTTEEKTKLAGIEEGANKTIVEDSVTSISKTNVASANSVKTAYDLATSKVTGEEVDVKITTAIAGKLDKVEGKQLSTEDYTTAEKTKLSKVEEGANKTVIEDSVISTSTVNGASAKAVKQAYDLANTKITGAEVDTKISTATANLITSAQVDEKITTANSSNITSTQVDEKITTAMATKVDTVTGKQLSTEDYTTAEKTKLSGVATGANKTVVVNGVTSTSTTSVASANAVKTAYDLANTANTSLTTHVADTTTHLVGGRLKLNDGTKSYWLGMDSNGLYLEEI